MHRYYVHVLDSLLQHQTTYAAYQIRHPFPPYATHYLILLALSHLVSFDTAEKLFVCVTFLCFAIGLRLTAQAIGPSGEWASLFVTPLLFSWALMMGFFNFILGLSLVLLATGFWERSRHGSRWALLWYLLALAILTFTHPIPLLLLIATGALDLVLNFFFRDCLLASAGWIRRERVRLIALSCTVLAAGFPALAVDRNARSTATTVADTHFKIEFVRTTLLLSGMSPYNSRAHSLWINGYRLCLYAILLTSLWVGGKAGLRALKQRRPNLGTTLFIATIVLAVALPILPNSVNGSFYFTTRLVLVLWPAALLAASAADAPASPRRPALLALALCCAVLTMVSAQLFLRPVATQLAAAEQTPMPSHTQGLILLGATLPAYTRYGKQLAFDPYQWGSVLPLVREQDVALDSPWIDQKITPLAARPGSPLLVDDVSGTHLNKLDPPLVEGRSLPGSREARMVEGASFIVYAGTPKELAQGLLGQLSPQEAAKYTCTQPQAWYLVCLSRPPL